MVTEADFKAGAKALYINLFKTIDFVLDQTKGNELSYEKLEQIYAKKLQAEQTKGEVTLVSYYFVQTNEKFIKPSFVYRSMLDTLDFYNLPVFDKKLMEEIVRCKDEFFDVYFYGIIKEQVKNEKLGKDRIKLIKSKPKKEEKSL